MVRSEALRRVDVALPRIDTLTHDDVDAGLALSDAAGWNQTRDDWALFIGAGHVFGTRDAAGEVVATAAVLGYGARAWISLVLVAAEARHRGLASALMARCIDDARRSGAAPVLDATPAGAAVYSRLGFAPGFEFSRWEKPPGESAHGPGPDRGQHGAPFRRPALRGPGHADVLDRIVALDRRAHRLDRRVLFDSFLARPATRVWLADGGQGFVIARAGRLAVQIGPLVAADEAQAVALLHAVLDDPTTESGSRVFIDVPSAHRALAGTLASRGFVMQRPFVRMALADAAASRLFPCSFALAGPEFG